MTKYMIKSEILRIAVVGMLILVLVLGLIPNSAMAAETKIADAATIDKYLESLGDEVSTEYAGRIWTDKSVFTEDAVFPLKTGGTQTIQNKSDFLVSYSALATGIEIKGNTVTPMDVVFVIDMSSSMSRSENRMDNGKLRLYNATEALNSSVKELLAINEYVRIGVVGYSRNGFTILPLDHYEQVDSKEFFTCNGSTITVNANGTGSNDYNNRQFSTSTGTNIQRGLYEGMNMLASEDSITVNMNGVDVKRIPSVVLLTDGEPSVSSPDQEWWKPDQNVSSSTTPSPAAIHGMKPLMTAAYMKEAVNRHYNVSGASAAKVYSIGVGIEKVSNSYRPMAYATINPNDANLRNSTNSMVGEMRTAWGKYANNQTATLGGYTFNHPDSHDIVGDKDISQLYYVDDYYTVEDSQSMNDAFTSVITRISLKAAEVPTEMKHADPSETGYIHYTDPIGEYMEVKAVKGIIYNGKYYKNVSYNPETDVYSVDAVVDNELHQSENLNDIDIKVSTDGSGKQTLEIDLPASLIPLRINSVELNADGSVKSHTNNGSYPIRVIYEVGLKNGITVGSGPDRVVDTTKISATYLNENLDTATGNVNFYSNLYTAQHVGGHADHTAGNATAVFEPAHTNGFYYMQEDNAIYRKVGSSYQQVAGTSAADLSDTGIYYDIDEYYHGTSKELNYIERTGAQLKKTEIISKDGYLYREAGSPRLNRILEFAGNKSVNATETADDFYYPTFENAPENPDPAAGKYVIYLGNNGKLSIPAMGELAISKTVTAGEGLTAPDKEFTFTVEFNGTETLAGEFKYVIEGTDTTGTITDGGILKLKAGQTAKIDGLAPGTTYKVTETAVAGFNQTSSGDTGTIEVGKTSEAEFTNHYDVTPLTWTVDDELQIKKTLEGRSWSDSDSFTFLLSSTDLDAPMPAGSVTAGTHKVKEYTITKATPGYTAEFGTINFAKPGVYEYTVSEKLPATGDYLPGMTYSAAIYEFVVTVTDDGAGKLTATTATSRTHNHAGEEVDEAVTGEEVVFTNTYMAGETAWTPVGTKTYTDLSGNRPLTDGMFQFKIEPTGTNAADAPMPVAGTIGTGADRYYIAKNVGTDIAYPQIHFKHGDAGKEYTYRFTEVIPTGSSEIAGMTYDTKAYTVKVAVSADGSSHVKLDVTYPDSGSRVTFVNTYNPEDAKLSLKGTKTFNVGAFKPNLTTFTFQLEADNEAAKSVLAAPVTKTVNLASGSAGFAFDALTFDKTGVYVFNMKEKKGTAGGVTYDTHVTKAIVTVTDKNDGSLEAAVTYNNGSVSADTDEAKFVNTYKANPAMDAQQLLGTKSLTGKELVTGEFFFEIYDLQTEKSYLVSHKADEADGSKDGKAAIVFSEGVAFSAPGTYSYILKEQIPVQPVPGNTYDTTEYKYTVVVEDNGAGQLVITSRTMQMRDKASDPWTDYLDGGTYGYDSIDFNNTYTPDPLSVDVSPMHKVLEGDRTKAKNGEFEFELTLISADPADGITLPAVTKVKNDADGYVDFGQITFSKAGTYTVQVAEIIPAGAVKNSEGVYVKDGVSYSAEPITATYEVTDDRNGNLTARIASSSGTRTFINHYDTVVTVGPSGEAELTIAKDFTGRAADAWLTGDKFDFQVVVNDAATIAAIEAGDIASAALVKSGDAYVIDGLQIASKGQTVVIPDITFYAPDQTYKFNIREIDGGAAGITYDGAAHVVEIKTIDHGDGTMHVVTNDDDGITTDGKVTFKNVYEPKSTAISGHDNLVIHKIFTGREGDKWLDTDKFTFTLAAADDVTKTAIAGGKVELTSTELVVTNENRAYPHFGNIVFYETGTYQFVVTEQASGIAGVKDDENPDRMITVEVNDNGKGELIASVTKADSLTFRNTYAMTEVVLDGKTNLEVTKQLTGRDWFDSDAFEFTLEAADAETQAAVDAGNVILPKDLAVTITKADDGKAVFGDITFKVPGVYSFFVQETPGTIDNVAYDSHITEVVATVEDNQKGELQVVATSYIGSMTFENVYTPDEINISIGDNVNGKKVLKGRDLADDEFTFKISKAEGSPADTPMPAATSVTNKDSKINFGTITYTKAGTYTYIIKEEAGALAGIDYDDGIVTAVVKVTYDATTGKLNADVSYSKAGGNGGEGFVFINEYKATPTEPVDFTVKKKVTSTAGNSFTMRGADFEFEVEPSATNPKADPITQKIVENTVEGTVTFIKDAKFTQEGTYVYTIHEVAGSRGGITYDPSIYKITVVVTDNEAKAQLEADITVTKDGAAVAGGVEDITFENKYDPTEATVIIHGYKTLDSEHKNLEAGEFQFKLEAKTDDAPMPAAGSEVAKNAETGLFQFDMITYDKPGEYTYEVTEVDLGQHGYEYDSAVHIVKVSVKDVDGVLTATTEGIKTADDRPLITFVNKYVPDTAYENIEGTKKLAVPDGSPRKLQAGEFTFQLLDESGNVIGETTNGANGAFAFEHIGFEKAGSYNYKIVEKNSNIPGVTDDAVKEIPVKIDVNEQAGYLDAKVTYPDGGVVFTNTYAPAGTAIQLSSVKILEGRDLTDGEFTFQLTDADGKVIDEAQNNAQGIVTFDEIRYDAEGTYQYQISEVKGNAHRVTYDDTVYDITVNVKDGGEGYLVATLEQDGNSFKFVNVYHTPIVEADLTLAKTQAVDTGDGFGTATAESQQVKAGDKVKYILTVKNTATAGTASGITITDVIPEGLILIETDGVGVEHDGKITWNISPLDSGAERSVSFVVEVPEVAEETIWENIASVAYEHPDNPLNPDDPDDPDEEELSNKVTIETKDDSKPVVPDPDKEKKPTTEAGDSEIPDTGDHTNMMLWLMLLAMTGTSAVVLKGRRNDE